MVWTSAQTLPCNLSPGCKVSLLWALDFINWHSFFHSAHRFCANTSDVLVSNNSVLNERCLVVQPKFRFRRLRYKSDVKDMYRATSLLIAHLQGSVDRSRVVSTCHTNSTSKRSTKRDSKTSDLETFEPVFKVGLPSGNPDVRVSDVRKEASFLTSALLIFGSACQQTLSIPQRGSYGRGKLCVALSSRRPCLTRTQIFLSTSAKCRYLETCDIFQSAPSARFYMGLKLRPLIRAEIRVKCHSGVNNKNPLLLICLERSR